MELLRDGGKRQESVQTDCRQGGMWNRRAEQLAATVGCSEDDHTTCRRHIADAFLICGIDGQIVDRDQPAVWSIATAFVVSIRHDHPL